jgi:hypothetical protein
MRIAARRGRVRRCIALARMSARILYAMWRDGTEFDSEILKRGGAETAAAADRCDRKTERQADLSLQEY